MHDRYHLLTKNLRDFVIQSIKEQHKWQPGNVEQLVMMTVQGNELTCSIVPVVEICTGDNT